MGDLVELGQLLGVGEDDRAERAPVDLPAVGDDIVAEARAQPLPKGRPG
jgi:hypothetical protein